MLFSVGTKTGQLEGCARGPGGLLAVSVSNVTGNLWKGGLMVIGDGEGAGFKTGSALDSTNMTQTPASNCCVAWCGSAADPLVASGSDDGSVYLYRPSACSSESGGMSKLESVGSLVEHEDMVLALAPHPSEPACLLSAGADAIVCLWDVTTLTTSGPGSDGGEAGASASVLPVSIMGNHAAAEGYELNAVCWLGGAAGAGASGGAAGSKWGQGKGATGSGTAVAGAGTDMFVTGGTDGFVRLWDRRAPQKSSTGLHRLSVQGHKGVSVTALAPSFADPFTVAIGNEDGAIAIADLRALSGSSTTGTESTVACSSESIHDGAVRCIQFVSAPPSESLVSGGDDARVCLSSVAVGGVTGSAERGVSRQSILVEHSDFVRGLAFDSAARLITSASWDGTAQQVKV